MEEGALSIAAVVEVEPPDPTELERMEGMAALLHHSDLQAEVEAEELMEGHHLLDLTVLMDPMEQVVLEDRGQPDQVLEQLELDQLELVERGPTAVEVAVAEADLATEILLLGREALVALELSGAPMAVEVVAVPLDVRMALAYRRMREPEAYTEEEVELETLAERTEGLEVRALLVL